jgi:hypothetical protein
LLVRIQKSETFYLFLSKPFRKNGNFTIRDDKKK